MKKMKMINLIKRIFVLLKRSSEIVEREVKKSLLRKLMKLFKMKMAK